MQEGPGVELQVGKEQLRRRMFGRAVPVEVGRYRLVGVVGRGAMGTVFEAEDPVLCRSVALKLLEPEQCGSMHGWRRVKREAQALAKIQHPNVAMVHEVGEVNGRGYIAMEFVAGQSVQRWLEQSSHSTAEILDVFAQAGAGLAAAHAAGIVHGDFKPANVMLSDGGRVRVVDFGLARAAAEAVTTLPADSQRECSVTSLAGAGTPAYMAPEQRGGLGDERSDQYAFAVSLLEALTGQRPTGTVALSWRHPALRRLPGHVEAALKVALQHDPLARHPDMPTLLRALVPARRWTRGLAAVAGALICGAMLGATTTSPASDREPQHVSVSDGVAADCAGPGATETVWTEARRGRWHEVEAVAPVHSRPVVAAARQRLVGELTALDTRRGAACNGDVDPHRATSVARCIDRRTTQLSALVDHALDEPPDRSAVRLTELVWSLAPLSACIEASEVAPTDDDATLALRAELDEVVVLELSGEFSAAAAAADDIARRADASGQSQLARRARLSRAKARAEQFDIDATDELTALISEASKARDTVVEADAWISLIGEVGLRQHRHTEALSLRLSARTAVERASQPDLRARFALVEGTLLSEAGRFAEAESRLSEAREAMVEVWGAEHPRIATVDNNLANARWQQGRYDEAAAGLEGVIEDVERWYGAGHPRAIGARANLGALFITSGDWDRAEQALRLGLRRHDPAQDPGRRYESVFHQNLGIVVSHRGDQQGGLEHFSRALSIQESTLGSDHPSLAQLLVNIADCERRLGRMGDATEHARRSAELLERSGERSATRVGAELMVARVALGRDDLGAADEALRRVEALLVDAPQSRFSDQAIEVRQMWRSMSRAARG